MLLERAVEEDIRLKLQRSSCITDAEVNCTDEIEFYKSVTLPFRTNSADTKVTLYSVNTADGSFEIVNPSSVFAGFEKCVKSLMQHGHRVKSTLYMKFSPQYQCYICQSSFESLGVMWKFACCNKPVLCNTCHHNMVTGNVIRRCFVCTRGNPGTLECTRAVPTMNDEEEA